MSTWIDFRELRQKLKFEQVLGYYNIPITRKGEQHVGRCPLPTHGDRNQSGSFSANLTRGIFRCFGCRAQGNLIEFAALMEGKDPRDGAQFRTVALKLQQALLGGQVNSTEAAPKVPTPAARQPSSVSVTVVNAPLDFELKGLDYEHGYLRERGFTRETIRYFGLGVASRGSLKGMLVIPLHNPEGKLVGYAGHPVDRRADIMTNPDYRFPEPREHKGVRYDFRGDRVVYNAHRIRGPVDDLIVVDGFSAVWWLHQKGIPALVGTIAGGVSESQVEVITRLVPREGRVWLAIDGSPQSEGKATIAIWRVAQLRFVRWVRLDPNVQLTDLSENTLREYFPF